MYKLEKWQKTLNKEERKQKRKERREKFREEHPKLAEFIFKAQVTLAVGTVFGAAVAYGYSLAVDQGKTQKIFDETEYEMQKGLDRITGGRKDYIDEEGKYHEDVGYGCFAVWNSSEDYLNAQKELVENCKLNQ